jgi:hypothetical protein
MDPGHKAAVVHLDHNAGTKTRAWVVASAAATLLTRDGTLAARDASLTDHLRVLTQERFRLSRERRHPAIAAVVRAASRDLRHSGGSCRPRVVEFNATASALSRLWHGADDDTTAAENEARTIGLPLQLVRCTRAAPLAAWQTWRLAVEPGKAKTESREGVLRVLPCTGLCLAHRFSLAAAPSMCVSIGQTRTPRTPYTIQAALAPCAERTPADAMRGKLHYSASAGTLKTTQRISDLRRMLPEHRTTCGFWPECSGTRLLLPKPCWHELRTNISACGDTEEAVSNALARDRRLPESKRTVERDGFVVSLAGAVPAARINASAHHDRLCLSVWRGKFVENVAAVFTRCPQGSGRRWHSRSMYQWQAVPFESSISKRSAGGGGIAPKHTAVGSTDVIPEGVPLRIVPLAAPHLCLSAPPALTPRNHGR